MNNFLEFINEDITAKKTLIDTMPTRTKANKKKYNEKIEEIENKYKNYKASLLKYINSKAVRLNIKPIEKKLDKLSEDVANLEHVRFVLNPSNTYVEKIGFDSLLYEINHYSEFQFGSLNKILNSFIDKFELIKIKLNSDDFDYNYYVNKYMTAFLEVRNNKNIKYEEVAKIFEEIYWLNPNLIEHIELNLRSLIKVYNREFEKYIKKIQRELKSQYNIKDYEDCLKKLKKAYLNLKSAEEENIYDILLKSQTNEIEITDYLEDSKVRVEAYSSLAINELNFDDKSEVEHFYENITKLKENLIEYSNYRQFIPLMMDFKTKYEKQLSVDKKSIDSKLKEIDLSIKTKEKELYKLNKKILSKSKIFNKKLSTEEESKIKLDSVNMANELYKLYKEYEAEYFNNKVLLKLNESFTISEFLELYYSFDYFKKLAINEVFKISNYDELITFSENFDLFAMNLNNVIMSGVLLFDKENVSNVIVKKYRLSKINILDDDLHIDNIENIINKIELLLRIKKIEESQTTVENIWFLTKVKEINKELES